MSKPSDSAKKILIVDDDADTCAVFGLVLEQSGYRITSAGTIADCLRLAETEVFDLYLLDNWLPDGTGLDLCRQLRSLCPASPVLFCSGAAQKSDIQAARAAGAAGYLIKPCDIDRLLNIIAMLLSKKDWDTMKNQSKDLIGTSRELVEDSKRKIDTVRHTGDLNRAE